MTDTELYDAIVVVTPNDFKRVESNNKRIVDYLPVRKVLFVGSKELGELVAQSSLGDKAGFVMRMILFHLMMYTIVLEILCQIYCLEENCQEELLAGIISNS